MTLNELTDTLWNAGIAVLRCLKGFNGARLEGLVCARCFPDGAPADLTLLPLRHCPNPKCMVAGQPWAGPHYPRRS